MASFRSVSTMKGRMRVWSTQVAMPNAAPRQSMSGFLWPMMNTSPPPSMSWRRALAKSRILTRLCRASCCLRPP